jgi:hypothetical protein
VGPRRRRMTHTARGRGITQPHFCKEKARFLKWRETSAISTKHMLGRTELFSVEERKQYPLLIFTLTDRGRDNNVTNIQNTCTSLV